MVGLNSRVLRWVYATGTRTSVACLSVGGRDSSRLNADDVDADAAAPLARSEAQQNLPDRVELGRVDERISADVQAVSYTHLTLPTIYSV